MANRRLVEAINENRILYDSNPDLSAYGGHSNRVLVKPAYSRYSYQQSKTPLKHTNNKDQTRNFVCEHNNKQQNSERSERVLERIVVTDINSVSYKIPDSIQIQEYSSMETSIVSSKGRTSNNNVQQADVDVVGGRGDGNRKAKRNKNMYKVMKRKFRRWKKKMKKNGEETIARHTSFNLFCFKRRQGSQSPYQICKLADDEDGIIKSECKLIKNCPIYNHNFNILFSP
jgi:hypothetical protein